MPLYELNRRGNVSQDSGPPCYSGQSPVRQNDLFELVCENGQILMQGHSNAPNRTAACKSLPSQCLPSYSPRGRDMLIGNSSVARIEKFAELDSVINEIPTTVHSSEIGLNQDDDMAPWLNYGIENPLQHDYSSDLLAELSGVTAYELPSSSVMDKKSSYNHSCRNLHKVSVLGSSSSEQGKVSKVSSTGQVGLTILDTSSSRLYKSFSEQCQTSITSLRTREYDIHNKTSNGSNLLFSDCVTPVPCTSDFSDFKVLKEDSVLPSSSSTTMNFLHFARPAALVRANAQSIGAMCGLPSAKPDSLSNGGREFTPSSNNSPKSTPTDLSNGYAKESTEPGTQGMLPSKVDPPPLHSKPHQEHTAAAKPSEPVCKAGAREYENTLCQVPVEDTAKGLTDDEKSMEPVVASSVCSGNSVEKASDEPIPNKRRKTLDTEESECHSEDIEEESIRVEKATNARGGSGSKRSRAAEVHNLSERRRRDRINEKMRALQELIPNCNKVDKASMLDEAIEYLKTLQLQVQMMSMGSGFYMQPMILPTAMQHMHTPVMPSYPMMLPAFSPMSVGMHTGFRMGCGIGVSDINATSSSYPMMQMPTVQGTHFPTPPTSGQIGLNGMAGSTLPVFGLPGHGLHFSMSHPPLFSGAPVLKPNTCESECLEDKLDPASASGTKDQTDNRTTEITHNPFGNDVINRTSNQATPPECDRPALVEQHGHAGRGTGDSGKEDQTEPRRLN